LSEEDLIAVKCPNCSNNVTKTNFVHFECARCQTEYGRPNFKITKKKLRCTDESCPGFMNIIKEEDYYFCNNCKTKLALSENKEFLHKSTKLVESRISKDLVAKEFREELAGEKIASLDLVLVAPRHLFRMPYSLHEKTALSSIVLDKSEIEEFSPQQANPFKLKIKNFYSIPNNAEAQSLLEDALNWKSINEQNKPERKRISEEFVADFTGVTEEMFPNSIKKLLNGLQEGRKRGLFVLITFLKSLNFPDDYINQKVHDWNKKNSPPLKEGYVKSQIDWHIKQKKKIIPPNYSNDNFYKDLKLIDSIPKEKNPLVEVLRKLRR
jgi:DNA primase large subunit